MRHVQKAAFFAEHRAAVEERYVVFRDALRAARNYVINAVGRGVRFNDCLARIKFFRRIKILYQEIRPDKKRAIQRVQKICLVVVGKQIEFCQKQVVKKLNHENELRENKKKKKEDFHFEKQNHEISQNPVNQIVPLEVQKNVQKNYDCHKNARAQKCRQSAEFRAWLCSRVKLEREKDQNQNQNIRHDVYRFRNRIQQARME